MIHYTNCPVCGSDLISYIFLVKDHSISGEEFEIWECRSCSLRFTQDVPDSFSMGAYYKSENYISHSNISKGFINKAYKTVRNKTLRLKRKLVEKWTGLKKGSLLDLGSGIGAFVNQMQQHGWQVTGIEPDEDARKIGAHDFGLILNDINELYQLPADSFDAITVWHVLEHVHALHGYLDKLKFLLKKNGKLFIAVPNYLSIDAEIYKNYWAAYDVPRHLYHFTPKSMEILTRRHELKIISLNPMWFDSFYISMLSSKYSHGKINLSAAIWNGLVSNLEAVRNKKRCSSIVYIMEKGRNDQL